MDGVGLPVATHVRRTVLSITTSVLGGAITIVGDAGGGREGEGGREGGREKERGEGGRRGRRNGEEEKLKEDTCILCTHNLLSYLRSSSIVTIHHLPSGGSTVRLKLATSYPDELLARQLYSPSSSDSALQISRTLITNSTPFSLNVSLYTIILPLVVPFQSCTPVSALYHESDGVGMPWATQVKRTVCSSYTEESDGAISISGGAVIV